MKTAAELQAIAQTELCRAKTEHAEFLAHEMARIELACEENARLGLSSYRHLIEASNALYDMYGNNSNKMLAAMIESKLKSLGFKTTLYYSACFHLIISW